MRRRDLLSALAVAAVAGPAWVGRALAADPTERQLELTARWHAARRRGVPLLVILVPDGSTWERGRVVGPALCNASERLLAALSGYEPACATRTGLHVLGAEVPPDTWYVILGTDTVPAAVRAIAGPETHTWEAAGAHLERVLGASATDPAAVAAGRRAWVEERVPGSVWALAEACGTFYEGLPPERQESARCGQGSVPEKARRFLAFVDP